jgi:hypothetical protein
MGTGPTGAQYGPNYATDGTYVQNLNRTNVRNNMQDFTANLQEWITANCPTATVDQLLGGEEIVPVTLPFSYSTTLPYPTSDTTVWSAVPNTFRTSIDLEFYDPDTEAYVTMWNPTTGSGPYYPYTDTFGGTRLTMEIVTGLCGSGEVGAQLYLNGSAVGVQGPVWNPP